MSRLLTRIKRGSDAPKLIYYTQWRTFSIFLFLLRELFQLIASVRLPNKCPRLYSISWIVSGRIRIVDSLIEILKSSVSEIVQFGCRIKYQMKNWWILLKDLLILCVFIVSLFLSSLRDRHFHWMNSRILTDTTDIARGLWALVRVTSPAI